MQTDCKAVYGTACEVFLHDGRGLTGLDNEILPAGWYFRKEFPLSLADGAPIGPYSSERDALIGARSVGL